VSMCDYLHIIRGATSASLSLSRVRCRVTLSNFQGCDIGCQSNVVLHCQGLKGPDVSAKESTCPQKSLWGGYD